MNGGKHALDGFEQQCELKTIFLYESVQRIAARMIL